MERVIEAGSTINAPIRVVRAVLRATPELVFGEPQSGVSATEPRTFHSTIAVQLGSGTSVEHAVALTIGLLRLAEDNDDGFVATHRWDPIGQERLLPSFDGELVIAAVPGDDTQLTVHGSYVAPLGPIGRFGDAVAGRRLARHSLESHVERITERLETEAIRRQQTAARKPAPYNDDLRPQGRSEHYIG